MLVWTFVRVTQLCKFWGQVRILVVEGVLWCGAVLRKCSGLGLVWVMVVGAG
jgi:hypothetical protein